MLLILIFFSLDPQGPKADGTHKNGTFFLLPGYTVIDSCNPGDFLIWETAQWL